MENLRLIRLESACMRPINAWGSSTDTVLDLLPKPGSGDFQDGIWKLHLDGRNAVIDAGVKDSTYALGQDEVRDPNAPEGTRAL